MEIKKKARMTQAGLGSGGVALLTTAASLQIQLDISIDRQEKAIERAIQIARKVGAPNIRFIRGAAEDVIREETPGVALAILDNVASQSRFFTNTVVTHPRTIVMSVTFIPLMDRKEVMGVLSLFHPDASHVLGDNLLHPAYEVMRIHPYLFGIPARETFGDNGFFNPHSSRTMGQERYAHLEDLRGKLIRRLFLNQEKVRQAVRETQSLHFLAFTSPENPEKVRLYPVAPEMEGDPLLASERADREGYAVLTPTHVITPDFSVQFQDERVNPEEWNRVSGEIRESLKDVGKGALTAIAGPAAPVGILASTAAIAAGAVAAAAASFLVGTGVHTTRPAGD